MQTNTENKPNKLIFLIVIVAFGLLLLFSLRAYFTAFLSSVMFYVLFKGWMEVLVKKHKWKKGRAAILIIIISFFIILLPVTLFISMVYNKVAPVIAHPDNLLAYLNQVDATVMDKFGIRILSEKNIADIQSISTTLVSGIVNQGLEAFTTITMMYFFLYFLLINFKPVGSFDIIIIAFQQE